MLPSTLHRCALKTSRHRLAVMASSPELGITIPSHDTVPLPTSPLPPLTPTGVFPKGQSLPSVGERHTEALGPHLLPFTTELTKRPPLSSPSSPTSPLPSTTTRTTTPSVAPSVVNTILNPAVVNTTPNPPVLSTTPHSSVLTTASNSAVPSSPSPLYDLATGLPFSPVLRDALHEKSSDFSSSSSSSSLLTTTGKSLPTQPKLHRPNPPPPPQLKGKAQQFAKIPPTKSNPNPSTGLQSYFSKPTPSSGNQSLTNTNPSKPTTYPKSSFGAQKSTLGQNTSLGVKPPSNVKPALGQKPVPSVNSLIGLQKSSVWGGTNSSLPQKQIPSTNPPPGQKSTLMGKKPAAWSGQKTSSLGGGGGQKSFPSSSSASSRWTGNQNSSSSTNNPPPTFGSGNNTTSTLTRPLVSASTGPKFSQQTTKFSQKTTTTGSTVVPLTKTVYGHTSTVGPRPSTLSSTSWRMGQQKTGKASQKPQSFGFRPTPATTSSSSTSSSHQTVDDVGLEDMEAFLADVEESGVI
mmetsp:Transcript_26322/g.36660  ORF Transcript_26322/g.36660 Transcript_26322/m.36660 type:complete len:518 (+) Transcript_26322:69-1622(+)